MARLLCIVVALGAFSAVAAAPEPLVLGVARGFVQAAQTKVGAAQGLTNAAIRTGSGGVNLALDAVQGLEAVESNVVRGALNLGRDFGTEVLNQTRNLASHLPSGIRGVANLGVGAAQRGLDAGVNAATLIANSTQGAVNATVSVGKRISNRLSSAAQGAVSAAAGVTNRVLGVKDRALGAVQGLFGGSASASASSDSSASASSGGLLSGLGARLRLG